MQQTTHARENVIWSMYINQDDVVHEISTITVIISKCYYGLDNVAPKLIVWFIIVVSRNQRTTLKRGYPITASVT